MDLNQKTLILFEQERSTNSYIPPEKSNSYYIIDNGEINLFCERANPDDCRFNLLTENGIINTGDGTFIISGDIVDSSKPYNSFTIIENTEVNVNDRLIINKGTMNVHGKLNIPRGGQFIVNNGGSVVFYPDSTIDVDEGGSIIVEDGSSVVIYGEIDVDLSIVDFIIGGRNITIDSAAVVNVKNIDLGDREISLTDYETSLRDKIINKHTRGEYNTPSGRIGYIWKDGDYNIGSQVLELDVLYGDIILGDFKLSILGLQNELIENLQVLESIRIMNEATLHITEHFNGYRYIRPDLYLGIVIGNDKRSASCRIDGTVIVDGENCQISLDRGATLYITSGGVLELRNGARLVSTYNDNTQVLFIDGTLVIDDISQIITLEAINISFGDTGKVIIKNPDTGDRKVLFTTPIGIHNTDLYRIFENTITHIVYHINANTGIGIDKYYDYYSRDMTDWYGGMRIEKAIHEGYIVWHDGGFIELNNDIIPWADTSADLYLASRLFKSYGSYDYQKLQEVSERLKYAGCGNVIFRFIDGSGYKDIELQLDDANMKSVVNKPLSDQYILEVGAEGNLFLTNGIADPTIETVIKNKTKQVLLQAGENEFDLTT